MKFDKTVSAIGRELILENSRANKPHDLLYEAFVELDKAVARSWRACGFRFSRTPGECVLVVDLTMA